MATLKQHSIGAGLIAGSVAAVAAILLQLPLRSPNDSFLNSASVMLGALAAGVLLGFVRSKTPATRQGALLYAGTCAGLFAAAALFALIGESRLERLASFVVPLAAVVVGLAGPLTLHLSRHRLASSKAVVVASLAVAVALGIALAGLGDAPSGHLEIPPRAP